MVLGRNVSLNIKYEDKLFIWKLSVLNFEINIYTFEIKFIILFYDYDEKKSVWLIRVLLELI